MRSEYFSAEVADKLEEPFKRKEVIRNGFFGIGRKVVEVEDNRYYLSCRVCGTDARFRIKIEVDKDRYDAAEIDSSLSIMLEFKYKFASFHFGNKRLDEPRIYTIRKEG
jgi:hypothetical protein